MKYTDLTAVEEVNLERMSKVMGGFSLTPLGTPAVGGLAVAIPAASTALATDGLATAAGLIPPDQVATFVAIIQAVT